jgi:hypothetical protein
MDGTGDHHILPDLDKYCVLICRIYIFFKDMKSRGKLFGKRKGTCGRWGGGTREDNSRSEYGRSI